MEGACDAVKAEVRGIVSVLDPGSSNKEETMLMDEVLALALSSFSSPSRTVTGTFEMMALGRSNVRRRLGFIGSSDLDPSRLVLGPLRDH